MNISPNSAGIGSGIDVVSFYSLRKKGWHSDCN